MKTKFDQLINAQKRKLDMCEMQIVRHNNEIAALQSQISAHIDQISKMQIPKGGSFDVFLQANARKRVLVSDIDSHQAHISAHKAEISKLEVLYRALYLEYEKLKHIQEKERENIIKAFKKRESKELDEIAILLHKKERA